MTIQDAWGVEELCEALEIDCQLLNEQGMVVIDQITFDDKDAAMHFVTTLYLRNFMMLKFRSIRNP